MNESGPGPRVQSRSIQKGVPVKRRFMLSLAVLFFSLTAAASDRVNLPQCRGIKVTAEMRETVREAKADPKAAYAKKRKVPAAVACESAMWQASRASRS